MSYLFGLRIFLYIFYTFVKQNNASINSGVLGIIGNTIPAIPSDRAANPQSIYINLFTKLTSLSIRVSLS